MKVYLASWFSSKEETKARAKELEAAGITVTSRWLQEAAKSDATMNQFSNEYLRDTALTDVEDILEADLLVGFTVDPQTGPCHRRGGRHTEIGMAILPKEVVICGPRENIFHYLPWVKQFDSWEETKSYLIDRNKN